VLVDVIPVLEVVVTVVDVVDMVTVLDRLMPVTLEVLTLMVGVDGLLCMPLAVMEVVHMPLVFLGFVAVAGEVLVICCWVTI